MTNPKPKALPTDRRYRSEWTFRETLAARTAYASALTEYRLAVRNNASRRLRGLPPLPLPPEPSPPMFPFAFDGEGNYLGLVTVESPAPPFAFVRWAVNADAAGITLRDELRKRGIGGNWEAARLAQ